MINHESILLKSSWTQIIFNNSAHALSTVSPVLAWMSNRLSNWFWHIPTTIIMDVNLHFASFGEPFNWAWTSHPHIFLLHSISLASSLSVSLILGKLQHCHLKRFCCQLGQKSFNEMLWKGIWIFITIVCLVYLHI